METAVGRPRVVVLLSSRFFCSKIKDLFNFNRIQAMFVQKFSSIYGEPDIPNDFEMKKRNYTVRYVEFKAQLNRGRTHHPAYV